MKDISASLLKLIHYLYFALIILTPLIWFRFNSELFEFPKMVFVYAMTVLIASTWIARMLIEKRPLFKRSVFDVPILIFLFSQVISTILSIHPHTSVFGYYSRFHGGLLSSISYIILFYAFISNFDRKATLQALGVLVSSSLVSSLYALPEHFGYAFTCLVVTGKIEATCWVQDVQTRIFGSFGQPNWLAAYIVTTLPVVWAALLRQKHQTKAYWILLIANLLIFATLIFTKSRSGLLALLTGAVVFVLLLIPLLKRFTTKQLLSIPVSLLVVGLVFGTEFTPSLQDLLSAPQTETQSVQTGSVLEQDPIALPTSQQGGTESGKIRQIVWRGALDAFIARPLFGYGVETFAYAYYFHRPVEHNLVSEWDFLYNKAHNEVLNILATTGIVGFIAFLLWILFFLRFALLHLNTEPEKQETPLTKLLTWIQSLLQKLPIAYKQPLDAHPEDNVLLIALIAGFVALNVSNFFGFSTVSVGVLFFLFPAFAVGLTSLEDIETSPQLLDTQAKLKLVGSGILALVGVFLVFQYFRADLIYARAQTAESEGAYDRAISMYERAISLSPSEAKYHNDFADLLSKAAYAQAVEGNAAAMVSLAEQAFSESSATLRLNPVHNNYYKTQAGVFIRLSTLDPSLLEVSETILTDALSLAPTDAKLIYNLGLIKLDQLATPSAQTYFEQAVDVKADYEAARMQLGEIYLQNGELDKAREQFEYILKHIAPGNTKAKEYLEEIEAQ